MNINEFKKIKEKALEDHIPIIMDDTLETIDSILSKRRRNKRKHKKGRSRTKNTYF